MHTCQPPVTSQAISIFFIFAQFALFSTRSNSRQARQYSEEFLGIKHSQKNALPVCSIVPKTISTKVKMLQFQVQVNLSASFFSYKFLSAPYIKIQGTLFVFFATKSFTARPIFRQTHCICCICLKIGLAV